MKSIDLTRKIKKSVNNLVEFYNNIYDYYEISDTFARHKETLVYFKLHDCDGLAFEDVFFMFLHHYKIKNAFVPFALRYDGELL